LVTAQVIPPHAPYCASFRVERASERDRTALTLPLPARLLPMMIAVATRGHRCQSGLRPCGWNGVGRGAAYAADSELARSPAMCA